MEYYSPIKNELLIHTTIWMNLKGITLNERSQFQKVTYCMIPFIKHCPEDKIIVTENRLVIARGLGLR